MITFNAVHSTYPNVWAFSRYLDCAPTQSQFPKHLLCLLQLRRMDMEARSFSQEKSQQLMRKVKEYKADLKKITEDSRQAQGAASGNSASCNNSSDHCLWWLHL